MLRIKARCVQEACKAVLSKFIFYLFYNTVYNTTNALFYTF